MSSRPSLVRSIPFWVLVAGSVASIAAGGALLADKLGIMTATLTDGSATGLEVYVGQTVAIVGAILVGAGVIGVLLALTVASLATLRPAAPLEIVEPLDWSDDVDDIVPADEITPEIAPETDEASSEEDAPAAVPTR